MKRIYTYSIIYLALLLPLGLFAQVKEVEELKSLEELKQIERGIVEVDEIGPVHVIRVPNVDQIVEWEYNGITKIHLRKNLEELSLSKKFTFNVDDDYSSIEFFVMGKLESGSLRIKLTKPDKSVLKDITIISGKDFDWAEPFLLDKVKKTGIGVWVVEISADKASGLFQFYSSSR